jgi:hypothetical protein
MTTDPGALEIVSRRPTYTPPTKVDRQHWGDRTFEYPAEFSRRILEALPEYADDLSLAMTDGDVDFIPRVLGHELAGCMITYVDADELFRTFKGRTKFDARVARERELRALLKAFNAFDIPDLMHYESTNE